MDTESWIKYGNNYFPTYKDNSTVIEAYIPEGMSPYDALIAPLWAHHENLPPALIQVGGLDPLCDEGREYAFKLQESGVEATYLLYLNYKHGFLQFYKNQELFPRADLALKHGLSWLYKIFTEASKP